MTGMPLHGVVAAELEHGYCPFEFHHRADEAASGERPVSSGDNERGGS